MGVNVLVAWLNAFEAHVRIAANKWRGLWSFARDADLIRAHADCEAADVAMSATVDAAERDAILAERWAPAYAGLCTLPAHTRRGLQIKLQVLLAEHESGASAWGDDLRRTTRAALALPPQ